VCYFIASIYLLLLSIITIHTTGLFVSGHMIHCKKTRGGSKRGGVREPRPLLKSLLVLPHKRSTKCWQCLCSSLVFVLHFLMLIMNLTVCTGHLCQWTVHTVNSWRTA